MNNTAWPIVIEQRSGPNLLIRALCFIVFGLWFSSIRAAITRVWCVTVIGLPPGLWMLNRLPQVVTLAPQRSDLIIASGRAYRADVPQRPCAGDHHAGASLAPGTNSYPPPVGRNEYLRPIASVHISPGSEGILPS